MNHLNLICDLQLSTLLDRIPQAPQFWKQSSAVGSRIVTKSSTLQSRCVCDGMVTFLCWVCSHGESQRFGSTATGRYKTDFNGLSLARLGREHRPDLKADQVFGLVQASTDFTYHSLAILGSPGKQSSMDFGNQFSVLLYMVACITLQ